MGFREPVDLCLEHSVGWHQYNPSCLMVGFEGKTPMFTFGNQPGVGRETAA